MAGQTGSRSGAGVGQAIKAERQRRGLTQREFAALVRRADRTLVTSAGQVKRWERGQQPQPAALRALATVLGRSVEELTAGPPDVLPEPLDVPPTEPADASYVQSVYETVARLVALEVAHGGNEVAPIAVRALRAAQRRVNAGAYLPAVERDLQAAVAELAETAAWLLTDAGRPEPARAMNHEALFLARLAGDRSMELFTLANLSYLDTSASRPGAALQIARSVLCAGGLTSRIEAIFGIRQARALAMLGDRDGALRAVDRFGSRFYDGASDGDPAWTWWVTEAEIVSHAGRARMDLGDHREAVELLQRAVDLTPAAAASLRFTYLTRLLGATVAAGAWHDAVAVVERVMPYVAEVGSARTAGRLHEAVTRIETAAAPARLHEAAGHLRGVLTAAG
jgi:transcriptional regulator with XRE-family HTH domain